MKRYLDYVSKMKMKSYLDGLEHKEQTFEKVEKCIREMSAFRLDAKVIEFADEKYPFVEVWHKDGRTKSTEICLGDLWEVLPADELAHWCIEYSELGAYV